MQPKYTVHRTEFTKYFAELYVADAYYCIGQYTFPQNIVEVWNKGEFHFILEHALLLDHTIP